MNQKLKDYLTNQEIEFQVYNHEETPTSVESALARERAGAPSSIGAKALLISTKKKVNGQKKYFFHMFIFEATALVDGKIVSKKNDTEIIRAKLGSNRFANKEELETIAFGLIPGSIPPFGKALFPDISTLFIDPIIFENEFVSFNAGKLTQSILIRGSDYKTLVKSEYIPIGQET